MRRKTLFAAGFAIVVAWAGVDRSAAAQATAPEVPRLQVREVSSISGAVGEESLSGVAADSTGALILFFFDTASTSAGPVDSAQTPPLWALTPELRIGGAEDDANPFTHVSSLAVSRAGTIVVADELQASVSVYDARGRLLRKLGRKGSGPGEFQLASLVGMRGDSVFAYDPQMQRLTLFAPDGRPATTVSAVLLGADSRFPRVEPGVLLADGSVLGLPLDDGPAAPVRVPLVRMDRSGRHRAAVAYLDWSDGPIGSVQLPRGPLTLTRPISGESLWDATPAGDAIFVVSRPVPRAAGEARFRVTRLTPRGDTIFSRSYRQAAVRVSRQERDGFLTRAAANPTIRQMGADSHALAEGLRIPEFLPPITEVVAGRDGTLWLRREGFGREQVEWLVLDGRGDMIGRLRLPATLAVHQADRRNVWGVLPDEDDVPRVIRYRVNAAQARSR